MAQLSASEPSSRPRKNDMIFRSQIILKELCFLLENEFFCTPSFSLKMQSSEAKKELAILNTG